MTTQAEEHEALVRHLAKIIQGSEVPAPWALSDAHAILAEVHRTLSTVTERMQRGGLNCGVDWNGHLIEATDHVWSAMLAASPITPGEG